MPSVTRYEPVEASDMVEVWMTQNHGVRQAVIVAYEKRNDALSNVKEDFPGNCLGWLLLEPNKREGRVGVLVLALAACCISQSSRGSKFKWPGIPATIHAYENFHAFFSPGYNDA
jgi:hypothetical protein